MKYLQSWSGEYDSRFLFLTLISTSSSPNNEGKELHFPGFFFHFFFHFLFELTTFSSTKMVMNNSSSPSTIIFFGHPKKKPSWLLFATNSSFSLFFGLHVNTVCSIEWLSAKKNECKVKSKTKKLLTSREHFNGVQESRKEEIECKMFMRFTSSRAFKSIAYSFLSFTYKTMIVVIIILS